MDNERENPETFEGLEQWWIQVVGPNPDGVWIPGCSGRHWMSLIARIKSIVMREREEARRRIEACERSLEALRLAVKAIADVTESEPSDDSTGGAESKSLVNRVARAALGADEFARKEYQR